MNADCRCVGLHGVNKAHRFMPWVLHLVRLRRDLGAQHVEQTLPRAAKVLGDRLGRLQKLLFSHPIR